jgi:hypothetical protein
MKTYQVEVLENLVRIIDIEADNSSDALKKVEEMYKNGEIILDSDDYVSTEINII